MKIYLATDHAGFDLKEAVKKYLAEQGLEFEDCGNFQKDENDDYPDWISKAAEKVSNDQSSRGVIFGKSGGGEAIVANKFKNVKAVVGFSPENVRLAKEHNNANVLALGSDFTNEQTAKELVDVFFKTSFSNEERHVRRINKISSIENK